MRKFASKNRVNRIILLSDGMANVGPSSPSELGTLGANLAAEGISVATIGLGASYNEDLMVELAVRSDGSHAFVQHAADLARFLDQELGAVAAVVARDVEVKVLGAAGTHPLRVIGRRADVVGQTVTATLGKVNGGRQHVFVIEMDVDPMQAGSKRAVAEVEIAFRDLLGNRDMRSRQRVEAEFTTAARKVEEMTDPRVMSELGILNAGVAQEQAIQLRDQADFAGAKRVLEQNAVESGGERQEVPRARVLDRANKAKQQAQEAVTQAGRVERPAQVQEARDQRRRPQRPVTAGRRPTACDSASASCSCSWSQRRWRRWRAGRVGGAQRAGARRQ